MKYIDTNVLLRIMTGDVPELASRGLTMLASAEPASIKVLSVVVEECCFILEFRGYELSHKTIYESLSAVLSKNVFVVSPYILMALEIYRDNSKLDFADCLLAVKGKFDKKNVLTFDSELQKALK